MKREKVSKVSWVDLLNHDFCPNLNKYLYWLKQPIGWFVLAMAASLLVGAFASPIGWTIAFGLAALVVVGLLFPWVSTRFTEVELYAVTEEVHEGEQVDVELRVRNRLPIPLFGLTISGYLAQPEPGVEEPLPEIGLAQIPAFSVAKFRVSVTPETRGTYPVESPFFGSSFPFGIWTSRKEVTRVCSLLVRPLVLPLVGETDFAGKQIAEVGDGARPTSSGEFLGVRDFRAGDTLKSIHWTQTARLDSFVVCERGGPEHQPVVIDLDFLGECNTLAQRENLSWRIRVAASLVQLLGGQHIPFSLRWDGELVPLPEGAAAVVSAWRKLAAIPLDGQTPPHAMQAAETGMTVIRIARPQPHDGIAADKLEDFVRVEMRRPTVGIRNRHVNEQVLLDLERDLAKQFNDFVGEIGRVPALAS